MGSLRARSALRRGAQSGRPWHEVGAKRPKLRGQRGQRGQGSGETSRPPREGRAGGFTKPLYTAERTCILGLAFFGFCFPPLLPSPQLPPFLPQPSLLLLLLLPPGPSRPLPTLQLYQSTTSCKTMARSKKRRRQDTTTPQIDAACARRIPPPTLGRNLNPIVFSTKLGVYNHGTQLFTHGCSPDFDCST